MGTKRRTCPWHKRDGVFVVNPGWVKDAEISFQTQSDMIKWAHGMRLVLKYDSKHGNEYRRVYA